MVASRQVVSMSTASKPTFAQQVKATIKALNRPNCLNFKTKSKLNRHEVIKMLKQIDSLISKFAEVAELKVGSFDGTCRTTENVLERYLMLKNNDYFYILSLYERKKYSYIIRLGFYFYAKRKN